MIPHRRLQQLVLVVCLIHCSLSSTAAFAQATGEDGKNAKPNRLFAAQLGPLLPNQIAGISEIMPTWNAQYGFLYRKAIIELGVASAKGSGVTYYNGFVNYRGDFDLDDMVAIAYVGIDVHHYYPEASGPAVTAGGGHVGGGFITLLGDNIYFRSDMKFNVNPGTALYIGFGLEIHLAGGGEGEQQ